MENPAETKVDLRALAALNLRAARENAWGLAVALSLLVAAAIPVLCFAKLWPLTSAMPSWDQWSMLEIWDAHYDGRPVLPLLLRNYNGHYNWVPRFLFYGMGLMTRWDLRAEVLLCYLSATATLLLLLRMLWEVRPRLLVLAAPVSACVFSLAQFENFLSGYPLGQMLAQLFATAAIFLVTRPGRSVRAFAGAVVCGIAATLSHGSATGVWPAGLLALLAPRPPEGGRRPWGRAGVWLGVTAAAALLARTATSEMGITVAWPRLVPFFLAVLGHPLTVGTAPPLPLAETLGALLLAAFVALVVRRYRTDPSDPLLPCWGSYGALAVFSAMLVAMGRANAGVPQALASHYVTTAWPLLVAVMVLAAERWQRAAELGGESAGSPARRPALAIAALAVAVLLQTWAASAALLPVLRASAEIVADHDAKLARGTATDAEIQQSHHPYPDYVRAGVETLRANRLAWFAGEATGETIKGHVDLFGGQPLVAWRAAVVPGTAWTFEGWAAQSEGDLPVERVELAVDGVPAGSATPGVHRPDVEQFFGSSRYRFSGWRLEFPAGALLGPGEHAARFTARDRAGNAQFIGEVKVAVGTPVGLPAPPAEPVAAGAEAKAAAGQ